MNSAHTVILERTDTRKLSGSGRGRVSFQNGRKHIVMSFLTDHQGVTETGCAGTERREPQDEPERSLPAHKSRPPAKKTTTKTPDARQQKVRKQQQPEQHRSAATGPLPHGKGGGTGRQTHLGAHPGRRNEPQNAEDIKKAPGGTTSEGSKGRRLPTLPPLLGQYHRHKCV